MKTLLVKCKELTWILEDVRDRYTTTNDGGYTTVRGTINGIAGKPVWYKMSGRWFKADKTLGDLMIIEKYEYYEELIKNDVDNTLPDGYLVKSAR